MNAPVGWASLGDNLDVPLDQDLQMDFRFWAGRSKSTPADITAATGYLRLCGAAANALTFTVGDTLTIAAGVVSLRVPQATLATLSAGATYEFELQVTASASPRQVRGTIMTRAGLAS